MPGRWEDARQPNQKEIDATTVVLINIEEASAKIRTGPPVDDEEDYQLPVWAGVIPVQLKSDKPERDPELAENILLPGYIENFQD